MDTASQMAIWGRQSKLQYIDKKNQGPYNEMLKIEYFSYSLFTYDECQGLSSPWLHSLQGSVHTHAYHTRLQILSIVVHIYQHKVSYTQENNANIYLLIHMKTEANN